MPSNPNRTFAAVLASSATSLLLGTLPSARAEGVILYQNGFESADTCAWTATEPAVSCDPGMVFVPAGPFTMGDTVSSGPVHTVSLSSYWIDRTEVTVDQYADCVAGGGCAVPNASYADFHLCNWGAPWGPGDEPVNCVDWSRAQSYCAWAGKRLPTEAEWEKAARGTDTRTYAWGEATPICDYAVMYDANAGGSGCNLGHTGSVGSKPAGASPYGALDTSGNVWEWVADWYDALYYWVSPPTDPPGPATSPIGFRVFRGGSWANSSSLYLRTSVRYYGDPSLFSDYVGLRCARDG